MKKISIIIMSVIIIGGLGFVFMNSGDKVYTSTTDYNEELLFELEVFVDSDGNFIGINQSFTKIPGGELLEKSNILNEEAGLVSDFIFQKGYFPNEEELELNFLDYDKVKQGYIALELPETVHLLDKNVN